MPAVVHTPRWLDQITGLGWDLHLFAPSIPSDLTIHEAIPKDVLLHLVVTQKRAAVEQTGLWFPFEKGDRFRAAVTKLHERFTPRPARLANLIESLKPDIVHSLEMQGATYLTLESKKELERRGVRFPKWIYSCWGNDIYHFGRQPAHSTKIREVLGLVDYLIVDCERDECLARDFGFSGELLGVMPTGGGFEIEKMQTHSVKPTSERKVIALKGFVRAAEGTGRSLTALDALEKCADRIRNFELVLYSSESVVEEKARRIGSEKEFTVTVLPPSPHDEFVKLFGRTRVSIGLNISDGSPNTMLESMIMGAFPVQSNTQSTAEWIDHGRNGFLVDPEDADAVANAIVVACQDDDLANNAAMINDNLTRSKLERSVIKRNVIDIYKRIANT